MNTQRVYVIIFVLALAVFVPVFFFATYGEENTPALSARMMPEDTTALARGTQAPEDTNNGAGLVGSAVMIGDVAIPVEIVESDAAVRKGLSGRASLDAERGMLFVFAVSDRYRFWMPDMHFPIDILWIENGTVVDITPNVSNEFDPLHPRFYAPAKPVRYVLEVNAGFAKLHGITVGERVRVRYTQ